MLVTHLYFTQRIWIGELISIDSSRPFEFHSHHLNSQSKVCVDNGRYREFLDLRRYLNNLFYVVGDNIRGSFRCVA